MILKWLKSNKLLLVFFAIYLLTVAMSMLIIDTAYYQDEKRSYIVDSQPSLMYRTFDDPSQAEYKIGRLKALIGNWLDYDLLQPKNAATDLIDEILEEPNFIYRVSIRRVQRSNSNAENLLTSSSEQEVKLDRSNPRKMADYNNFKNSLFLRNFSRGMNQPVGEKGEWSLWFYYTTPLNDSYIIELTNSYRLKALLVVLALTTAFYLIYSMLLLPLRNVTNCLEVTSTDRTVFSGKPRSRLEELYNKMALDAVAARLHGQLRDEIARRPQMTGWEVVTLICRAFCEQINSPLVACMELVAEGPGRIRRTGQQIIVGQVSRQIPVEELAEFLDNSLPRDGRTDATFELPAARAAGVIELITDPARTGVRYLFALGVETQEIQASTAPMLQRLERLTELVEAGLQTLSLRNQLLVQERGRANISLSRNLGHDLTNIIATSKLELMALDRILGRDAKIPEDERKRRILGESLQGLLKSVRFMQETVNLYRSYAFLQHPVLELQDSNQLVWETVELFSMSISSKIDLHTELDEETPRCMVDPRLIKLALFNMFSNAMEAIRKADPEYTAQGWIKVVTRRTLENGLCIALEDSGTGILNSIGKPADKHEIEKIFELGYTSYRQSGTHGEGLGLNWVRTIVQDLHGGRIYAENIPNGGARFILTFPSVDNAPDLENTERQAADYMRQMLLVQAGQNDARKTDPPPAGGSIPDPA